MVRYYVLVHYTESKLTEEMTLIMIISKFRCTLNLCFSHSQSAAPLNKVVCSTEKEPSPIFFLLVVFKE